MSLRSERFRPESIRSTAGALSSAPPRRARPYSPVRNCAASATRVAFTARSGIKPVTSARSSRAAASAWVARSPGWISRRYATCGPPRRICMMAPQRRWPMRRAPTTAFRRHGTDMSNLVRICARSAATRSPAPAGVAGHRHRLEQPVLQQHRPERQLHRAAQRSGRFRLGQRRAGGRHRGRQLLGPLDRQADRPDQRLVHAAHLVGRRCAAVGQRCAGDRQLDRPCADHQHQRSRHAAHRRAGRHPPRVLRARRRCGDAASLAPAGCDRLRADPGDATAAQHRQRHRPGGQLLQQPHTQRHAGLGPQRGDRFQLGHWLTPASIGSDNFSASAGPARSIPRSPASTTSRPCRTTACA